MIKWICIPIAMLLCFTIDAKAQTVTGPSSKLHEQNTMSVLWFQKAGEAKALYYQGYNLGKCRLDEYLNKKKKDKSIKPAIVLDIDETILDNSPYFAWYIVSGNGIPFEWSNWFNRAEAKPLPGALEFLKYADSKGVEIFYISNRFEAQKDATIKNLQMVGAPQADKEHVLLMQHGERGKETRRQNVAKNHEIVLLFGDNLGDFSQVDELSVSGRLQAADKYKDEWGKKFIILPNPMYGDWEEAIYDYNNKMKEAEKEKLRKEGLMPK
ncbi:5'-nucleotidase (lipoprotein e(P4) family) [Bacillus sp. SORGH_AS 510]|nr:5'-nucleotidase, lipoprotein e(P4) family [Bacillus sp. SORGH_AS_0510]MDQ1147244.1 5'-nucleotidase (lipoprotein e(P4) family) [Bacillus sp. SORGH_AS_0510]